MKTNFKIYSKKHTSYSSDTIFSIIGSDEPSLTKALAYCLNYSKELLALVMNFFNIYDIQTSFDICREVIKQR